MNPRVVALIEIVSKIFALSVAFVVAIVDLVLSTVRPRAPAPKPKTVLITGATSGIGEELAVTYAEPGVTLALCGRNERALEATKQRCEAKGAIVFTKKVDVTDREALAEWILEVDTRTPVDLVFANAGVSEQTTNLVDNYAQGARTLTAINLDGVFNTVLPLLDRMRARQSGQIALMASLASYAVINSNPAYSATKHAVRAWGESLRLSVFRDGVRVNVICPGFVKSAMADAVKEYKPFEWDTPVATAHIKAQLAADEPVIAFPWQMYILAITMNVLPFTVRDFFGRFRLCAPAQNYRRHRSSSSSSSASASASSSSGASATAARSHSD